MPPLCPHRPPSWLAAPCAPPQRARHVASGLGVSCRGCHAGLPWLLQIAGRTPSSCGLPDTLQAGVCGHRWSAGRPWPPRRAGRIPPLRGLSGMPYAGVQHHSCPEGRPWLQLIAGHVPPPPFCPRHMPRGVWPVAVCRSIMAPADSRVHTTSVWPPWHALCRGDTPFLVCRSTVAPLDSRAHTTSV